MRTFLLTVGALATAIALAGCGGDDNEQPTGRTVAEQATTDGGTTAADTSEAPSSTATREDDLGESEAETTGDGGSSDDSDSDDDGNAAGAAVATFFKALSTGDGDQACSLMVDQVKQQLEKSLGKAPQFKGKGCEGLIAAIAKNYPPATRTQLGSITVIKTAAKGDDTVLVTYKSGATPKATIAVVDEGGTWKIGSTGAGAATP